MGLGLCDGNTCFDIKSGPLDACLGDRGFLMETHVSPDIKSGSQTNIVRDINMFDGLDMKCVSPDQSRGPNRFGGIIRRVETKGSEHLLVFDC